ncbi:hypothetical protein JXB01_01885 [Candidatus Micrarchaeota archaeon]|nr:hypothetical protein [Candidatus Micrarchaeota archaeon]
MKNKEKRMWENIILIKLSLFVFAAVYVCSVFPFLGNGADLSFENIISITLNENVMPLASICFVMALIPYNTNRFFTLNRPFYYFISLLYPLMYGAFGYMAVSAMQNSVAFIPFIFIFLFGFILNIYRLTRLGRDNDEQR